MHLLFLFVSSLTEYTSAIREPKPFFSCFKPAGNQDSGQSIGR